jgi:uncharacterized membrane protein YfcA
VDSQGSERGNVTRLIRFVALFVFVPTVTIGAALMLYAPGDHAFHMVAFLLLAVAAVLVWMTAPRLAEKWVPVDAH